MFSIFSKLSYVSSLWCSQRCRTKYYIYVNTITIYRRTVNIIYTYTANQHHSIMGSFNSYKFPDWHGAFLNSVDPPRKEKKEPVPPTLKCHATGMPVGCQVFLGCGWSRQKNTLNSARLEAYMTCSTSTTRSNHLILEYLHQPMASLLLPAKRIFELAILGPAMCLPSRC